MTVIWGPGRLATTGEWASSMAVIRVIREIRVSSFDQRQFLGKAVSGLKVQGKGPFIIEIDRSSTCVPPAAAPSAILRVEE